jgi:hypothetical protein
MSSSSSNGFMVVSPMTPCAKRTCCWDLGGLGDVQGRGVILGNGRVVLFGVRELAPALLSPAACCRLSVPQGRLEPDSGGLKRLLGFQEASSGGLKRLLGSLETASARLPLTPCRAGDKWQRVAQDFSPPWKVSPLRPKMPRPAGGRGYRLAVGIPFGTKPVRVPLGTRQDRRFTVAEQMDDEQQ